MFRIYLLVQTYSGVTLKPLPGECVDRQRLTSSRAVVLQLVAVHRLLGVRPFPGGAMNIERREETGMKESVNEDPLLFAFLFSARGLKMTRLKLK